MIDNTPKISDSVMDELFRESGLYIPRIEDRVLIVKELEHARLNDYILNAAPAAFHERMQSADIRLKYRGDHHAALFARSLIGSWCSKKLAGTELQTEYFDWNYHTAIGDNRQAQYFKEERADRLYDLYLETLGRDVLTPEQNEEVAEVEELEKSEQASIGKALKHLNNAISIWNEQPMRGRNRRQVYRVAKVADAHFERALITGLEVHYKQARAYVPALKASLVFVTTEKDLKFIKYVIDKISKTPSKYIAVNSPKHSR